MKIVLDSNVFSRDYAMAGSDFTMLLSGIVRARFTLYVSQIVYDEVLKNFQKHLRKPLNDLRRIGLFRIINQGQPDLEATVNAYKLHFNNSIYNRGAIKLPIPNTSHTEIVQRAISRKKPFHDSGKGYQDTLIWYSVLSLLQTGDPAEKLVFVSDNYSDFANSDKSDLHGDLRSDLSRLGIEQHRCIYYRSLKDLVNEHIKPTLDRLDAIVNSLEESGTYLDFDLYTWINTNLGSKLSSATLGETEFPIKHSNGAADVSDVYDVKELAGFDARKLDSGALLISFKAKARIVLDYYVHKGDIFDLDSTSEVTEFDWNDHVSAVEKNFGALIQITMITEQHDWNQIETVELSNIREVTGNSNSQGHDVSSFEL